LEPAHITNPLIPRKPFPPFFQIFPQSRGKAFQRQGLFDKGKGRFPSAQAAFRVYGKGPQSQCPYQGGTFFSVKHRPPFRPAGGTDLPRLRRRKFQQFFQFFPRFPVTAPGAEIKGKAEAGTGIVPGGGPKEEGGGFFLFFLFFHIPPETGIPKIALGELPPAKLPLAAAPAQGQVFSVTAELFHRLQRRGGDFRKGPEKGSQPKDVPHIVIADTQ
jgi:hypothetical protein